MSSNSRTQRVLEQVGRRQQWVGFARRWRLGMLGASGLYLLALLGARLLALWTDGFRWPTLGLIPALALLYALASWRRVPARASARLIDARTGSKELFLTTAMLAESPGDYQPIVLQQAEERAAAVRPAQVVPFLWQNGAQQILGAAAVLVLGMMYLPHLDPFGKQGERQKLAKEEERLQATKKLTALRAEQLAESPKADQVERALAALDKTFKGIKPDQKEANLQKLAEQQKQLGELWRQVKNELPREAFEKGIQSFGQMDPKKAEKWAEELKKGELAAVKKELSEMREAMKQLAAMGDSAEKRAAQEQLQQKLNALSEALKQQVNSPSLNAALQRAMEQLDLAKLQSLSQEALEAAQDSLNLSEDELEKLAQSMKDGQSLEDALKNLQAAKKLAGEGKFDGEAAKDIDEMAEYAALFASLCNQPGTMPGGQGMGPGGVPAAGGRAPENDALESAFKSEKESGKFTGGKTLLEWKTKEVGETGARAEDYRDAVREAKQRVSEAIATEQVPPGYHGAIQKYFDSMAEK